MKMTRRANIRRWLLGVSLALSSLAGAAEPGSSGPQDFDRSKLVLELRFDGNLHDSSDSPHPCAARGQLAFLEGRHGQCASFDGGSWVDTGLSQDALGEQFTVECWVHPGPQQSQHADIFGNHVSEGLGFVLQQNGANTNEFLAAYGAGGGRWVLTDAVPLSPGRWQRMTVHAHGIRSAAITVEVPHRDRSGQVQVKRGLFSEGHRLGRVVADDQTVLDRAGARTRAPLGNRLQRRFRGHKPQRQFLPAASLIVLVVSEDRISQTPAQRLPLAADVGHGPEAERHRVGDPVPICRRA